MKKTIRRLIVGLTLATTAATGYALTDTPITTQDTTWGAPDTAHDSRWDVPAPGTGDTGAPAITPLDTTWG
jgi:hypothetical protein